MFQVGDYIVYGSSGVCEVKNVGTMDMSGIAKGRLYYTLLPVYSNGSTIYTPVDNEKIVMRKILTKEEAMERIRQIPEIEPLWIADEKKREESYKEAMKTCSFENLIKIIKTLYLRRQSRLAGGKKLATIDERYLKMAEDGLYGELAISLDMKKEEMEAFITKQVEQTS
ncbi:MAG: CarD family transcriptional regulator [Butyribacter sp.]|nr:CarD family transcriptional regulator [bacterium]MDY3854842.1 CarD family transcriptional regulator [Butyribacter sp.]